MTDVDICSLSLTELGVESITSFFEESRNAKLCSLHYPTVRDAALVDHPWNFAMAQAELAELSAPLFDWAHRFQLPNDPYCLVVDHMEDRTTKFEIQGRTLLTDAAKARIGYIFQEKNPTNFSPLFVDTFIFLMASRLAVPIKQDTALAQKMMDLYEQRLERARNIDGREGGHIRIVTNDRMRRARL